ncbi:hypothetical protein OQA88_12710 [Cercophora sp. LCS_1]
MDDYIQDFSNNLATDPGPLLALFGDAMTVQYLSECTTVSDYVVFAMAPIGIITAIVSVIRVCGGAWMRAFIGRSREGFAMAEVELCTSTGRDVCEMFTEGGITRALGRPFILELAYDPLNGELDADKLWVYRKYLQSNETTWWEEQKKKTTNEAFVKEKPAAGEPNKEPTTGELNKEPTTSEPSKKPAAGEPGKKPVKKHKLVWLQPGNQKIGDQLFGPYAMFETANRRVENYAISSTNRNRRNKRDDTHNPTGMIKHASMHTFTVVAVVATGVGFILQFIGLRGLNAWVSIAQLIITIIMSLIRGGLRMKRRGHEANELRDDEGNPTRVVGYELDWLAFNLGCLACSEAR